MFSGLCLGHNAIRSRMNGNPFIPLPVHTYIPIPVRKPLAAKVVNDTALKIGKLITEALEQRVAKWATGPKAMNKPELRANGWFRRARYLRISSTWP